MTLGKITAIHEQQIDVDVSCQSACSGCAQKDNCMLATYALRKVSVPVKDEHHYVVGQEVNLNVSRKTTIYSVSLAYVFPLLLILATLNISLWLGYSEDESAIITLWVWPMYFWGIYLFRKKLSWLLSIEIDENPVD